MNINYDIVETINDSPLYLSRDKANDAFYMIQEVISHKSITKNHNGDDKGMISPIFNMNKVKFDIMDKLNVLDKSKSNTVIFINLENVFKTILTTRINNFYIATKTSNDLKLELMSNIVNLAQHYMLYCAKSKLKARVVLYWNYPEGKYSNSQYIPSYRDYYYNKMFNSIESGYIIKCLSESYNFLKTMLKYTNGIYLVDSTDLESSVIPYILKECRYNDIDNTQYVLVTNSKYEYQYVNYGFNILVPSGIDSKLLNSDNIIDYMKTSNAIKNKNTIPSNHLAFVVSLLGDKYRSIPKINGVGLSTIIKTIRKAIDSLKITENTSSVEMLSSIISENYREQFINNYKCVNIELQAQNSTISEREKILSQLLDKFDENALDYINERYFRAFPLMIVRSVYRVEE